MASMKFGLESRSPLVDHKFFELAGQMPFNLKVHGRRDTKYIFKKALEDILPKEVLRRLKVGFTIPLGEWFMGDIKGYAKSKLLGKNSQVVKFTDKVYIESLLDSHSVQNDIGVKLWTLLTLELWFQAYFN